MNGGYAVALAVALLGVAGAHAPAAELRDPTRPPAPAAAAAHAPKHVVVPQVSAIFVSAARRVAIFDSQPVHEGDRVGDYVIETITATGVRYRLGQTVAFCPLTAVADRPPTTARNP
jgi:hypothetical protein